MQFIVIAYDGTDERAMERRLAVRDAHLKLAKTMYESGKWLFASAILNDAGNMVGSVIFCDFSTRDELDQWLKEEPYVTGDVWQKIEINRAQAAPFCLNKS